MISVRNLRKSYGSKLVLKGISVDFVENRTTAIVGPNASGKTTLVKCMLGLVVPDGGEVIIDRNSVSYMKQEPSFPENLKVKELFDMVQDIRGEIAGNLDELIQLFSLGEHLYKPISALSYGTKQKVNAVLTLMFDKPILILDEPTVGMDPLTSSQFRKLISSMDKTVIFISHIVSEVERFADYILFLIDGNVVFYGQTDELKHKTRSNTLDEAIIRIVEDATYS